MTHPDFLKWTRRSGSQFLDGYSLVELFVAIALLVMLMAAGIPLYSAYIEKAKMTRAAEDISDLQKEIFMYKLSKEVLPRRLSDIKDADLVDPYGRPYQYQNFSHTPEKDRRRKDRFLVPLNEDYDLYSMGRDGQSEPPITAPKSHDDIVRANDGMYIGPAWKF